MRQGYLQIFSIACWHC